MTGLSDSFQRPINYLRISVTDRCNLRCIYCMPPQGIKGLPHSEILSYEEICLVAQAAVELGINKLRITGGEPLVRRDLPRLIKMLSRIDGVDDLALTTNGVLLGKYAESLMAAGLKRVNVSLDSLKRDRFQRIARRYRLGEVLDGIASATDLGLEPVKINMVALRGINDDEVTDFARLSIEEGWNVRYIELMPFGAGDRFQAITSAEIRERLNSLGELEPCLPTHGNGPAKYFQFKGAKGTVGFISPLTEHICFKCNRLRLTASGKLRPCLMSEDEIDLKAPLRQGASIDEIKGLITRAVEQKPEQHRLSEGIPRDQRPMSQVGG